MILARAPGYPRGMHNKNVISFVALLILVALVALAVHCTPKQQQQAIAVLRAGESGCVEIQKIHNANGQTETVCVAVEDVRAAVEAILKARASLAALTASASATSSAAAAPSGGAL